MTRWKLFPVAAVVLLAARADALNCPSGTVVTSSILTEWQDDWCERRSDGRKHGPFESRWIPGGTPRLVGQYVNGRREGTWKSWYPSRIKSAERSFSAGQSDGVASAWYADGTLRESGTFLRGKRQGRWMRYFPNGAPSEEEHYDDGKLHGVFRSWHSNGAPSQTGFYVRGLESGDWTTRGPQGEPLYNARSAGAGPAQRERLRKIVPVPVLPLESP